MRLLIVSDAHSSEENAIKLREKLSKSAVDAVLLAGDLSNEGSNAVAESIISSLSFTKLFAVPGNMDSNEILAMMERKGISIHRAKQYFNDCCFIGIGGAKPVNTYYRLNLSELEAEKYLKKLSSGENPEKTILLSHSPPYGTSISRASSGIDLGVRAIRAFIESFQPLIAISGHVHEAPGFENIGKTTCINPGPLKDGNYAIAEISSSGKLSFERGFL